MTILLLNQFSQESCWQRLMLPVFSSTCVASWHFHEKSNWQKMLMTCFCFFASSYLTHITPQTCLCVLMATKSEFFCNSLAQCFTDSCIEEFDICRLWDFLQLVWLTREESEMFSEKTLSINASTCLLYFSFLLSFFFFISSRKWKSHKFAWNQRRSCKWSISWLFVFTVAK